MSQAAPPVPPPSEPAKLPAYETVFHRFSPLRGPYRILFWPGMFVLATGLGWALSRLLPPDQRFTYLILCALLSAGFLTVPVAIRLGYWVLRNWAGNIPCFVLGARSAPDVWFAEQLEPVRGTREMALTGAALGVVATFAYWLGGFYSAYDSALASAYVVVLVFSSAFFGGLGLHIMVLASAVFWRLGELPGVAVRLNRHRFGVLSTGTTLFKCWFLSSVVWSIYVASALFGLPGHGAEELLYSYPVLMLACPTLPVLFGAFIVCQYPLHRKMVAVKQHELVRIDELLESETPASLGEITDEHRASVEFLEKQRERLRGLPEWPFEWRALVGTGLSSVTAVFPVVMELGKQLRDYLIQ